MKSILNLFAYVLIFSALSITFQSKLRSAQIKFATTTSSTEGKVQANAPQPQTVALNSDFSAASHMSMNKTDTDSIKSSSQGDEEPKIHAGNCFMKMNNYFYDLYPLSKTDLIIKGKDGSFNNFNLCKNVDTVCSEKKGTFVNKDTCSVFSNVWTDDKIWTLQCK
jgi:hypothetical protein